MQNIGQYFHFFKVGAVIEFFDNFLIVHKVGLFKNTQKFVQSGLVAARNSFYLHNKTIVRELLHKVAFGCQYFPFNQVIVVSLHFQTRRFDFGQFKT